MLRLKTIWVIVYIGGSECEFVTFDMKPTWSTRRAARLAIVSKFGEMPSNYKIRKFVAAN